VWLGGREGGSGRVHLVPLKEKMGHLSCITYMTHITATKQYNQRKWQTKETRLRVLRKENLSIRQIYNKKKYAVDCSFKNIVLLILKTHGRIIGI